MESQQHTPKVSIYEETRQKIAALEALLDPLAKEIIAEECKYKANSKVWYKTKGQKDLKQGLVKSTGFDGVGTYHIDGKWKIAVQLVNDNWQKDSLTDWVWLGKEKGDTCILDSEFDGDD